MIELICGAKNLKVTPYDRDYNPDYHDWINVWIEFSVPELKTQFKTALSVYELFQLKKGIATIYRNMVFTSESSPVNFYSL